MKKIILLLLLFCQGILFSQDKTITRIESVQSLYIEVFKDSLFLGKATGFVIKSKTQNYLITNWHVATNKNPTTKDWINPKVPISPNSIVIVHNGEKLGDYVVKKESLIDEKGVNTFKEFSIGTEMVDVVAIPLKDTISTKIYPVDYKKTNDSLVLKPTDRLFVLGFPKGVRSSPVMPIWKSGLIASEPDIDQENKPIIWLDIESYGGMSGSPVYLITDKLEFKNGTSSMIMGNKASYFIGVFSHKKEVNIGALWKSIFLKKEFDLLP
jgi:hypothetical protein